MKRSLGKRSPQGKRKKGKERTNKTSSTTKKISWNAQDNRSRDLLMEEPESPILALIMEKLNVGEHVTMWHISLRHDFSREGKPWMDFLTEEGFEMPKALPRMHLFRDICDALPAAISAGLVSSKIAMA